ncbi:MAG: phosphatidate cytidylyltransferase [Bacteroidetes bacterium]|nr:phosphatidate cytidylyltransferase [Bacteroidota bacterium]MBS1973075.1 phosphatidate cytidylyltransferase [Bacteroidota bacterium]
MAFNFSVFRTRALTALIFVAVMLTGLVWNFWSFFILFSIIHFGCWAEYQQLIAKIDPGYSEMSSLQKYNVMLAGWCLMLFLTGPTYKIGSVPLSEIGYWAGLFFWFVLPVIEILISRKLHFRNMMYSIYGLLYISLSWALLTNLRSRFDSDFLGDFFGKMYVMILVASIWINDTMAYIVGSLIGKTPLTKISPKKTWEGTVGGIILSVVVMGLVGYFSKKEAEWDLVAQIMIVAAVASVAGTLGDVLESKLKRMANVKDSGHIMPGHGGFLDRFDSLLLATPLVWACIVLFLK